MRCRGLIFCFESSDKEYCVRERSMELRKNLLSSTFIPVVIGIGVAAGSGIQPASGAAPSENSAAVRRSADAGVIYLASCNPCGLAIRAIPARRPIRAILARHRRAARRRTAWCRACTVRAIRVQPRIRATRAALATRVTLAPQRAIRAVRAIRATRARRPIPVILAAPAILAVRAAERTRSSFPPPRRMPPMPASRAV